MIYHRFDLVFDCLFICAFFRYDITHSIMLFGCFELWIFSASYPLNRLIRRDGVLHTVFDPIYSTNRIRMSLTQAFRSEEHTFELQSRGHLVCRLLLEKKKE